ncbi:MAG: hypothetical protein WA956_05155 [Stenotrophomonas sp.]
MSIRTTVPALLALAFALPAHAGEGPVPGRGLHEIPDPELNLMRGRYTVGGNAVAWFGVTMISVWQAANGQRLQGGLTLGMDFSKGKPSVSFTPSVSITAADAPLPGTGTRSIDGSGLGNVSGLVQSVQVAGDGNTASNVLQLNVRDDGVVPEQRGGVGADARLQVGNATAVAGFDGNAAQLELSVDGQGAVRQWLRSGSVGQSIQLMADGQQAGNRLQVDLVRQALVDNRTLAQNVAQAISLNRGMAGSGGH